MLPIGQVLLRRLFEASGLDLEPGQFLLLDDALGTRILEEALGAVSREELDVRERKIRLLAASLGLEGMARRRPQGGRPPRGEVGAPAAPRPGYDCT